MAEASSNGKMTVIGSDTYINGEMSFEKSARIEGKFDGKITAKGELAIADGAECKAEVQAASVQVDGTVEGNLSANDKVVLNTKARITGDIVANKLTVAEGASINGRVTVGPDAAKQAGSSSGGGSSSSSDTGGKGQVSSGPQQGQKK